MESVPECKGCADVVHEEKVKNFLSIELLLNEEQDHAKILTDFVSFLQTKGAILSIRLSNNRW